MLVVTFGKGFGVSGAAVLCSSTVADYLLQFARHLIYSTSTPPAQAQALRASLAVIRRDEGDARREKLVSLIARFRAGVQDLPFTLADSCSAIQPLIVGDNSRALQLAETAPARLLGHGDSPANRTRWYCATALNANRCA